MSKERYELRYVGDWYCYVYDNEKQQGADICSLDDSVRIFNEQDKKIKDLETKLANLQQEQIKEMQEHQEAMKLADKTIKATEEQNKRVLEKLELIVKDNQDLQKRLDETDRELYLTKDTLRHHTNIYNSLFESRQQDKISFALEQLEKVKESVLGIDKTEIKTLKNGFSTLYVDRPEVITKLDNQIKQLKGEK